MKRVLWFLAPLVFLCALAGCSKPGTNSQSVDLAALRTSMIEADDSLPNMLVASSESDQGDQFQYLFAETPYQAVAQYFFAYSSTGTADELAVIQLKDPADVSTAEASLQKHVQERVKLFSSYKPEEAKRAEAAVVYHKGPYAILIMCDNPNSVKTAVDQAISD